MSDNVSKNFVDSVKSQTKSAQRRLRFKIRYTVRELRLDVPAHNFDYGGPHTIKVVLRAPSQDEIKIGHNQSNAFCIASSVWPVNEKNRKIFEQLIEKRSRSTDENTHALVDTTPEGQRIIPPLSRFPQYFSSFVRDV